MVPQYILCTLILSEHNKVIRNKLKNSTLTRSVYVFVGVF